MNLQVECPSTLRPGSKIMFVGEAPGACEVRECDCKIVGDAGFAHPWEGFVGKAGRVWEKTLALAGLTRAQVSLDNVVKRAPDDGFDAEHFRMSFWRFDSVPVPCKDGKPSKRVRRVIEPSEELLAWYDDLKRDIEAVKPNIVVACGGQALYALTGIGKWKKQSGRWMLTGITNWQGSMVESTLVPGLKVIPILHPSSILRQAQWQEVYIGGRILRDKVVPQSKFLELKRESWQQFIEPSFNDVLSLLEWLTSHKDQRWSLDLECIGGSIACIGIGTRDIIGGDAATCIPIQTTSGPYFSLEQEKEVWEMLNLVLLNNFNVVGHNLIFDFDWLMDYGLAPHGIYMDTMMAFHRLYPELPKSLEFVVALLLQDISFYKMEAKTWGSSIPNEKLWNYNCIDDIAELRLSYVLDKELDAQPMLKQIFHKYDMPLFEIGLEMQYIGLPVNLREVMSFREVIKPALEQVRWQLFEESGGDLAVKEGGVEISNTTIHKYLYQTLGLKEQRKPKTGKVTAEEDALVDLMLKYPKLEVLKLLLKDSHLTKALTSYVNAKWEEDL